MCAHSETEMAEKRNPFERQVKSLYREVTLPTLGVKMPGT